MDAARKAKLLKILSQPLVQAVFWGVTRLPGLGKFWLSYRKNALEFRYLSSQGPQLTVHTGPFAGLRYGIGQSVGSVLAPKLIGSYEAELHHFFSTHGPYAAVLDIGCAEGYYAVGCARLWPQAQVHAYDIDAGALRLCKALADENRVADRVHIHGACTPDMLESFPYPPGRRTLVISDCEGYEATLFTADTLPALASADILIEVHTEAGPDFIARTSATAAATHSTEVVTTRPRKPFEYPGLEAYTEEEQRILLSEVRDGVLGTKPQHWLLLLARG